MHATPSRLPPRFLMPSNVPCRNYRQFHYHHPTGFTQREAESAEVFQFLCVRFAWDATEAIPVRVRMADASWMHPRCLIALQPWRRRINLIC